MGMKTSFVEIHHDEGYGDDLVYHINLALRGKDMRAVKVVSQCDASPTKLELREGGFYELANGDVVGPMVPSIMESHPVWEAVYDGCRRWWYFDGRSANANWIIVREAPPAPKYRPFASAEEFKPHRERWIRKFESETNGCFRCDVYENDCIVCSGEITSYVELLAFKFDDTGLPCGVEIDVKVS